MSPAELPFCLGASSQPVVWQAPELGNSNGFPMKDSDIKYRVPIKKESIQHNTFTLPQNNKKKTKKDTNNNSVLAHSHSLNRLPFHFILSFSHFQHKL